MNCAVTWGVARESLGQDPTADQVAEWWAESRRTAFREQAAFRVAFPTLETPAALFEHREARDRLRQLARLGDEIKSKGRLRALEEATLAIGMLPARL
ncbi:MAG: hypothetical protein ACYDGN_12940 [Acidimicrobiales bacterium]